MKLIFETDWQTMERSDRFLVFGVIVVKLLGVCNCGVEEDFVKAANLVTHQYMIREGQWPRSGIPFDEQELLCDKRLPQPRELSMSQMSYS